MNLWVNLLVSFFKEEEEIEREEGQCSSTVPLCSLMEQGDLESVDFAAAWAGSRIGECKLQSDMLSPGMHTEYTMKLDAVQW